MAVALLVVAPWSDRTRTPWTRRAAVDQREPTLWSGHNPDATGRRMPAPESLLRQAPTSASRGGQGEQALRKEALDYVASHPLRRLELIPLKLIDLNRGDSSALGWPNAGAPGERPFELAAATPIQVVADFGCCTLLLATLGRW